MSWGDLAGHCQSRPLTALELAELILAGRSFEQRVGDLVVSGYLFNMATIFEDFVTVALQEAFRPFGGRSQLQYRTHLDEAQTVPVRPDFVWSDAGVRTVAHTLDLEATPAVLLGAVGALAAEMARTSVVNGRVHSSAASGLPPW